MQIGRLSLTPALGVLYYDEISVTITMAFQRVSPVVAVWQLFRAGCLGALCQPDGKIPDREHVVLMASAGYSELPEEITTARWLIVMRVLPLSPA